MIQRRPWAMALIVLLALLALPASGRQLWSSGERSLEASGSVRQLGIRTQGTSGSRFGEALASDPSCALAATFPDCSAWDLVGDKGVTQGLTRVRLRLDGVWSPRLSATLTWDNEFRYGTLDTLFGEAGPRDTFFGWEEEVHAFGLNSSRDHRRWVTRIYRGLVRYEGEHAELRLGRQRIAWGVGRIWNPTDRLSFVPPLAIEQDQSLGADAVDARWLFSGFQYLQAVYAPGTSSDQARYALRWQGLVRDVDVSALAGVFEEAFVAGFDLAGNLAGAAVRLEAAWTNPTRDVWPVGAAAPTELDSFFQVVVSADYNFALGSGLYVLVEHLYNGNALGHGTGEAGSLLPFFESTDVPPPGAEAFLSGLSAGADLARGPFVQPASNDIFGSSLVVSGSSHITALSLSYEPSAALRTELLVLYDWDRSSAAFFPRLAFAGWDAAELSLGVQLFAGPERSEYGGRDALLFLQAEFFF